MDIKTTVEQLPVVQINFDEIKLGLEVNLKRYENLVVTEVNYKDCKNTRKELTSLKNSIETFRKTKKKQLEQPIKAFENQCKELVKIIEDVEKPIKLATDEFDNIVREKNIELAKKLISEMSEESGLIDFFKEKLSIKPEYGNLSMTESKIKADIEHQISFLKVEQINYLSRLNAVEAVVLELNSQIKSDINVDDYADEIINATDSMVVINHIKKDFEKIKEIENRAVESVPKENIIPIKSSGLSFTIVRLTGDSESIKKCLEMCDGVDVEVLEQGEI